MSISRFIYMFFLLIMGCSISSHEENLSADRIVGFWKSQRTQDNVVEIRKNSGSYEAVNVSDNSEFFDKGEVIQRFSYVESRRIYSGSHKWGGEKPGNGRWSSDNALEIQLINDNLLIKVYLDSYYTGGWMYDRVKK